MPEGEASDWIDRSAQRGSVPGVSTAIDYYRHRGDPATALAWDLFGQELLYNGCHAGAVAGASSRLLTLINQERAIEKQMPPEARARAEQRLRELEASYWAGAAALG